MSAAHIASCSRGALLLCAWLGCANHVQAKECSATAACGGNTGQDVVELRDGSQLCGAILFRDDGHSLIVVDAQHQNRTISWDDIACLDQHGVKAATPASKPVGTVAPAGPPKPDASSTDEADNSERSVWLDWDVRFAGTSFWKRYVQQDAAAWSWGMSGGIAFGATLHYAIGAAGGLDPIRWSDVELGLSGTVTYGAWHQINAGEASLIEQDFSLRLGARLRIGGPHSGVVAGISWLPTYVDFYGRQIKTPGIIHPLGMRVTLDLGDAASNRHSTLFRVALSYLPYIGQLPSMFCVSAG